MTDYNPKRANATRYTVASPGNGGKLHTFQSLAPLHRFVHLRGGTEAAYHYFLTQLHAARRAEIILRGFLYTVTWNGNVFLSVDPFVQLNAFWDTCVKAGYRTFDEDTPLARVTSTEVLALRKAGIVAFKVPPVLNGELQTVYPAPKGREVLNTWLTTAPSQNTVIHGFTA